MRGPHIGCVEDGHHHARDVDSEYINGGTDVVHEASPETHSLPDSQGVLLSLSTFQQSDRPVAPAVLLVQKTSQVRRAEATRYKNRHVTGAIAGPQEEDPGVDVLTVLDLSKATNFR